MPEDSPYQPSSVRSLETLINPTDRQREFLAKIADKDYVLYGGAAGGGKSYILRWWLVLFLWSLFKYRQLRNVTVAMFCEDYPALLDRQISKIRFEFPGWLGRLREGTTRDFKLHDNFGGGIIALRNLDDPSKYQSAEFAAIAVDELTKNNKKMFDFLRSRLRWPGVEHPKFGAGTNPGDIGGDWVKDLWILGRFPGELEPLRNQFDFVQAKATDNPHLNQAYWDNLHTLPPDLARRFADGDWSVFEGQYFREFDYEATFLDHDDFLRMWGPQYWQPIWVSIDWGSTHHAYVAWHTFVTLTIDQQPIEVPEPENTRESRQRLFQAERENPNAQVVTPTFDLPITYREYLISGLGEEALAEEAVRRTPQSERARINNVFLSPETGFESELMRGWRIGAVFVRHRMPRARPAFDDRIDGWRLMHDKLRNRVISRGLAYACWCITSNCPRALEAIPWAVADPKRDGDIVKEGDSPLLDVLDGLRYGIASYEYAQDKPAAERKREILAPLPVLGNQRFIADKMFDQNERQADAPSYVGRIPRPNKRHGRS